MGTEAGGLVSSRLKMLKTVGHLAAGPPGLGGSASPQGNRETEK